MMDMKKHDAQILPRELSEKKSKTRARRPIHWLPRLLVALLLAGLAFLSALAFLATQQALTISLPTRIYEVDRQASIDYQVVSKSLDGSQETTDGKGSVYVSALAQAVRPAFHYEYAAGSTQELTWSSQILAILRIYETRGRDQLLYESSHVIASPEVASQAVAAFQVDRTADIPLLDYQRQFQAFASQSPQEVRGELIVRLLVKTQAQFPSGLASIIDQPELAIPLTSDTFTIEDRSGMKPVAVWRWLPYRIIMTQVHPAVFPAAAALILLGLALWLQMTIVRRKDPFEKKLAWMKRHCRGRLMMIADKAWEPEWCITTQDFKTMVRTAKKLKHPVFCHVDRTGSFPVAYFYVYYGENNYCLTFQPDGATLDPDLFEASEEISQPLPDIPTLPEAPDQSPED